MFLIYFIFSSCILFLPFFPMPIPIPTLVDSLYLLWWSFCLVQDLQLINMQIIIEANRKTASHKDFSWNWLFGIVDCLKWAFFLNVKLCFISIYYSTVTTKILHPSIVNLDEILQLKYGSRSNTELPIE